MRNINILLSLTLLLVTSCINNDIPYPVIRGEVLKFEVEGQKKVTIDNQAQIINVELDETVNPETVKIKKFEITKNSTSTLDPKQSINLTKEQQFTITTYQDWQWKIQTTQPIEHKILVENQIGSAEFDTAKHEIKIAVTLSQPLNDITVKEFKAAPTGATYSPDPLTIKDFSQPVTIQISYWGKSEKWVVTCEKKEANVITLSADPWGNCAYLSGEIVEGGTLTPSFEYREATATQWQNIEAVVEQTKIRAKAVGLKSSTQYIYRAKLGDELANEIEFTTEATPLIPNMSMDEWTQKGKTWFPGRSVTDNYWSSGNEGVTSALAGGKDSNTFPTDDAVKGKAACITTISAPIVDLAAGSLFTGEFKLNITKPLDSPSFSQSYTGRPTKLSFWYKYTPKAINISKRPELIGQMDQCNIYVYLGDWEGRLKSSQMKVEQTPGIIAYGTFSTNALVSQYTKQTIDIEYYDTKRRPTQIIIVATSSIMGEQYIGGIGSTLWLDELEFSFD